MQPIADIPSFIKANPHWRVVLTPETFESERIKTLDDCLQLMLAAQVHLGGRTYPSVDRFGNRVRRGNDYIDSSVEIWGGYEYWRLFQSGQFVNLFSFGEDAEKQKNIETALGRAFDKKYAATLNATGANDFLEMMRTITEITFFTSRLVQRDPYGKAVNLTMQMNNVRGRVLTSFDAFRAWFDVEHTTENNLGKTWRLDVKRLVTEPAVIAIEVLFYFYERFNWKAVPKELVEREQTRFLEGKFR